MPKMISWQDRTGYSIVHDTDMARVSGFDEHHQEHFIEIPCGKAYRQRREEAVLKIMESIEAGDPPGQLSEKE